MDERMMNQQDHNTMNSPPPAANDLLAKRKRGRPRKDENSTPKPENLVGKAVSGVVERSIDAGYLLNVKVNDSDTKLRGVVFIPGRVHPITSETDVAPLAKMFKNNQSDQSLPNDQPMKEAAVTTDLGISESARALAPMPQASNGEIAVQAKEKDGVMKEQAATRLVDFFPTPEAVMAAQVPNLVMVEKEKEQQKSPGETRGFDLMAKEPVCQGEKVPEELQLELGNKTILSGDNNNNNNNNNNSIATTETDPKTSVSKSGFIANLFEGEDKKVVSNMEEEATPSVQ